mgnify:CR=1 FL=1
MPHVVDRVLQDRADPGQLSERSGGVSESKRTDVFLWFYPSHKRVNSACISPRTGRASDAAIMLFSSESGAEGVQEPSTLVADPVDIRRLHERMSGDPNVVPAEIVHHDHDDVGPLVNVLIGVRCRCIASPGPWQLQRITTVDHTHENFLVTPRLRSLQTACVDLPHTWEMAGNVGR